MNYLPLVTLLPIPYEVKNTYNTPKQLQRGILLHRKIDTFTDAHPIFRQSKHRLVPTYNHYAGVLVDIYYDYFLAKHWKEYSTISLEQYAQRFYNSLQKHQTLVK